jgi:hypothetical protein
MRGERAGAGFFVDDTLRALCVYGGSSRRCGGSVSTGGSSPSIRNPSAIFGVVLGKHGVCAVGFHGCQSKQATHPQPVSANQTHTERKQRSRHGELQGMSETEATTINSMMRERYRGWEREVTTINSMMVERYRGRVRQREVTTTTTINSMMMAML